MKFKSILRESLQGRAAEQLSKATNDNKVHWKIVI